MVPKTTKKAKAETDGTNHRAAQLPNKNKLACPECWGVPETVRNDGFSIARHVPETKGARKFRGTEFCNGQGRVGRHVLDKNWKPGTKPENSLNGEEFNEHGLKLHEQREQRREARKTGKGKAEKAPKAPKAKATKPKSAKKPSRPKTKKNSAPEAPDTPAEASVEAPAEPEQVPAETPAAA